MRSTALLFDACGFTSLQWLGQNLLLVRGGLGFHKTSTCFSLYNISGYPKRFVQALFIELLSSSSGCNLKSKDGYSVIC
ncbi:hypothetical protein ACLB2K_015501 [Fragaria x ananassa]